VTRIEPDGHGALVGSAGVWRAGSVLVRRPATLARTLAVIRAEAAGAGPTIVGSAGSGWSSVAVVCHDTTLAEI